MKKLSGLLVAGLMLGSASLFAQLPEADSMNNTKNNMHRDSSWKSKNSSQRDSTWRSNNSKNRMDTTPFGQLMQKDTAWRSNKGLNKRDSFQTAGSMSQDTIGNPTNEMDSQSRQADTSASQNRSTANATLMTTPDVTNWPTASKTAVDEMTAKYGKPDGVTADELIWLKKGVFEKIAVTKMESKHSFPIEHTDMMQSTIRYDVPEDKMDDLGKFDGSVTFDRTQGTISARCDKEANNLLALNLAHDIITGKKTTVSARKAFTDIINLKMKGGNPLYMAKLSFTPKSNTGDPDNNAAVIAKQDVSKSKTQKKNK